MPVIPYRSGLLIALLSALAATTPLTAQPDVLIEKATNGVDADVPPGPVLQVGSAVAWTYVVTNSGSRDLSAVAVTDDQGVTVSCPSATLLAGDSMTCTANGTAMAGQYVNVGTVTAVTTNGPIVSASDPSHYFGQTAVAITIEKRTEGQDADLAPGPILPVGSAVSWTYEVTNVGPDPLSDVDVTDDQGEIVTCPGTTLALGASMTCTANGIVQPGQYANIGAVTATLPNEDPAGASDASHYFGQLLLLEKATNGADADTPPGVAVHAGDSVLWTYSVTNPGPATITGLAVVDDQGVVVSCPDTALGPGETMICTGAGIAQVGQYANVGTASATLPAGGTIEVSDPSHYFGGVIRVVKSTNGQDANLSPGPTVTVGTPVAWTYVVTNLGADPLSAVAVSDDQGVIVSCPGTTLLAGDSMTCTAGGTATAGQYANLGTVTATHPLFEGVSDSDPSHYFGAPPTDYGDAADPPFPTLLASAGARHLLGSNLFLGSCVDSEVDGQPAGAATGDDTAAGSPAFGNCAVAGDDEDGVLFAGGVLSPGTSSGVDVEASAVCTLSAWIDFSGDGDWNDIGEDLFPGGTPIGAGANALTFSVPSSAAAGTRISRFRCTTDGVVTAMGQASDGEVEDHPVVVGGVAIDAWKSVSRTIEHDDDGYAEAGDTVGYSVTVENAGNADAPGVTFSDTPDPNTSLVVGSVASTQGTVTTGNTAGDTSVLVDLGTLAAGGSVTIDFDVLIVDPVPPGVHSVNNQGTVRGGFGDVLTDDPSIPGGSNPTILAVSGGTPLAEIPTADRWALLALMLALAGLGVRRLLP